MQFTELVRTSISGFPVLDIAFGPPDRLTRAFVVLPIGKVKAGLVFAHWFEPHAQDSNKTEFLEEAAEYAELGALSVLVEGHFPWQLDPVGADQDRSAILSEVSNLGRALDLLVDLGAPQSSLAVVGHDFGAMYGSLLAGFDKRPKGYVLMAATPRWADWFLPYWQVAGDPNMYRAKLSDLDPITHVGEAKPARLLFQFARRDGQYVPEAIAEEFAAAASDPKDVRWYSAGHRLNRLARLERSQWLAELLGLS